MPRGTSRSSARCSATGRGSSPRGGATSSQLPPDVDIDAERDNGQLDARIRAVIGTIPYEIDWLSTYRFHQRVVARMRLGRLFFAGDAAHALPPYGARGMNSGIQDVDNLAWKLDLVMRGRASERPTGPMRLRQLLGEQFVAVYFAAGLDDAYWFVEQAAMSAHPVPLRPVVCLPGRPGAAGAIGAASLVHDESGELRRRYGATSPIWYVVRPDGHIAAAGDARGASELGEILDRSIHGAPKPVRHVETSVP